MFYWVLSHFIHFLIDFRRTVQSFTEFRHVTTGEAEFALFSIGYTGLYRVL